MNRTAESQYLTEFNHKIINDPIYGCVGLSKTEVDLLDTRAMQRLRRIRQMGFASYVFPSGEHSRFVHSLGVLCIIGKMCDHLFHRYSTENADGINFTLDDVRLLRIAALLHDVGHFPFSHLGEKVYGYIENVNNTSLMIEGMEALDLTQDPLLLSKIANYIKKEGKDHEHLGALVIKKDKEIRDILEAKGICIEDICGVITGDIQTKPVHAQLLHSSLDADRLDYLLRDSRQAGVCFGNVELEYILRQIRIIKHEVQGSNGIPQTLQLIVFDGRGKHAIEHFLMGRYFHYTQVILHKTSMAFEAVAKALMYMVLSDASNGCPYVKYDSIVSKIGTEDFYKFTDDYFWHLLGEAAETTNNKFIKILWDAISKRKNIHHVITMTDIVPKMPSQPKSKPVNDSSFFITRWLLAKEQESIAKEAGIDPQLIGYVESKVSLESIPSHLKAEDCTLDKFTDEIRGAIRILDKDDNISFLASNNKSLINKMVDFTSNTLDVFVVGDIDEVDIEKLRKIIKTRAV